jgi:SOS-response transcriptional repressor LexA
MFTQCNHSVYQQDVYLSDNPRMASAYDRLLIAAEQLQGWETPSEVAVGLTRGGYEVTPQKLTNWKSRGVSKEGLLNSAPIIGCRVEWLQTGEGPMRDEPVALSGFANATLVQPGRGTRVPLLSTVPAGNWREIVDDYLMGGAPDYDTAFEDVGAHGFALTVDGDSMLPDYRTGDVIFINPDVSPSPGDYVVARNHKFEATFKQYRPRGMNDKGEDYFELVPLNENYPKLRSDLTPIEIIGVVVEHRRKVRRGGV